MTDTEQTGELGAQATPADVLHLTSVDSTDGEYFECPAGPEDRRTAAECLNKTISIPKLGV